MFTKFAALLACTGLLVYAAPSQPETPSSQLFQAVQAGDLAAVRSCRGPAPKPSRETENALTCTLLMGNQPCRTLTTASRRVSMRHARVRTPLRVRSTHSAS